MKRDRNEVHTSADSFSPQLLDEFLPVDLQHGEIESEDVEMPRVPEARPVGGKVDLFEPRQFLVVDLGVTGTGFDEPIQLAQLVNPKRRLNISQIVLEPCVDYFVVPATTVGVTVPRVAIHAVERQHAHSCRQRLTRS